MKRGEYTSVRELFIIALRLLYPDLKWEEIHIPNVDRKKFLEKLFYKSAFFKLLRRNVTNKYLFLNASRDQRFYFRNTKPHQLIILPLHSFGYIQCLPEFREEQLGL